jgi:hypothetical protein
MGFDSGGQTAIQHDLSRNMWVSRIRHHSPKEKTINITRIQTQLFNESIDRMNTHRERIMLF